MGNKLNTKDTNLLIKSIHWKIKNKYTEGNSYFLLLENNDIIIPFEVEVDRATYHSYEIGHPYIRSFFTLPHRWHIDESWFDEDSIIVLKTKYKDIIFEPLHMFNEKAFRDYFEYEVKRYLTHITNN